MIKKKIAIVGAAGYVGLELVSQLEKENYDLYAFTRDNGSFLLEGKKIKNISVDEIPQNLPFDIVINLAYPTTIKLFTFPYINKNILSTISKLTTKETKIIHVSTQAVFGFNMDYEVKTEFLNDRKDYAYIEAKLNMENLLNKTFPNNSLSIIRLGNVWGPGSGTWTGAVAERLLFGKYVGVEGIDGYANITDVKNVASYIIHLVKADNLQNRNIFHLSEFSHVKWSNIINFLAKELKVPPVYSDYLPEDTSSLRQDVKLVLTPPSVGDTYRKLVWGRYSGSYLRGILRLLGANKFQKIKKTETKQLPRVHSLDRADGIFLSVVTSKVEFKSVVLNDWIPLVSFDESIRFVQEWLKFSGYKN